MRDVADLAGVSVTSVSHYVNKTRPLSSDIQDRISNAMAELEYHPNALARSLRRKKTNTIGMIIPDGVNPFFAEIARGIEDASFDHDYNVILCNSDGDPAIELVYTDVLVENQVDGIIFVASGSLSVEQIHILQKRNIPLVVVDRDLPAEEVDSVMVDNQLGGWLATDHLIALGHRRISCITGPTDLTPSADRITGYRRALRENGIAYDETLVVKGDFQFTSGFEAARYLLALEDPPTAIFAFNDLMAVGAIRAATKLGFQVPSELSVVGFDDVRLASFNNPPLTTISQPKYEMGELAAKMLLERMQDRNLPLRRMTLNTSLIVRESTAPVRVG